MSIILSQVTENSTFLGLQTAPILLLLLFMSYLIQFLSKSLSNKCFFKTSTDLHDLCKDISTGNSSGMFGHPVLHRPRFYRSRTVFKTIIYQTSSMPITRVPPAKVVNGLTITRSHDNFFLFILA